MAPGNDDGTMRAVIEVALRHVPPEHRDAVDNSLLDLMTIGIGSLEMVSFICDLETTMSMRFPADMIDRENFRNLSSVADAIRKVRADLSRCHS